VARDIEARFDIRSQLLGIKLTLGQAVSIVSEATNKKIHHLITERRNIKGQHVPLANILDASEKLECEEVAIPLIGCGLEI
jgi:hypothetical protein